MREDLTKKLPQSDSEKLNTILITTQHLEGRFDKLEGRFDKLEVRFDKLEDRVDNIDSRLEGLESKVEQRLHDTRPIWHKVVADIAQLQTGQDAISAQMQEVNTMVRNVNRDQIVINDVIRRIQLDFHNIDERLHRLELNRNSRN